MSLPTGYQIVKEPRRRVIGCRVRDSWYRNHLIKVLAERGLTESEFTARALTAMTSIIESARISEKWKSLWIGPIKVNGEPHTKKTNPLHVLPAMLSTPFKVYHLTGMKKGAGPPSKDHLGVMVEAKDFIRKKQELKDLQGLDNT